MSTRMIYLLKVGMAVTVAMFLTFLMLLTARGAVPQSDWQDDEPYRVEKFDIETPGELEVRTSGGHITVEGTDRNTARVEMYVREKGESILPDDSDLDDFDIEISETNNKIKAIASRENSKRWFNWRNDNKSVSFVVFVPRQMTTDLKTSGGHIEVAGLEGAHQITTSGGHLDLSDIQGEVDARTSGGHITLDRMEGNIAARTSGGHIKAAHTNGNVELRTSGGHIEMEELEGQISARTSGGNIAADLMSIDSGGSGADFRTSGGNISITIPEDIGLNLDLHGSYVNSDLNKFNGEVERNEVRGSLNGGGPQLAARTSGGTINISFN